MFSVLHKLPHSHRPPISFLSSTTSHSLSPRYLSPTNAKSTKILSPNRRKKILRNINRKIATKMDRDPLHNDTENVPRSANIDVTKSIDSTATSSSTATTIDLEAEYDSISVGKLKSLHLFDKNIHSFDNIQNLSRAYNLIELNLHSNLISKMQMLDSLTKLKILNLSSNRIEEINGLGSLTELEELNLSSNRIKRLEPDCFSSQHKLSKLNLSYNYLEDISGLNATYFQSDGPTKLRYLDLKCNKISDEQQLEHLQHIKSLQTLIIEDKHSSKALANPICSAQYKHVIADTLPTLKWLNMQLFDAESHASKIQLIITSPSTQKNQPSLPSKGSNIESKSQSKKRAKRHRKTSKIKTEKQKQITNPNRRHKSQRKHKRSTKHHDDSISSDAASSTSGSSDSEYDSSVHSADDIKEASPEKKSRIPLQPRLMSPPNPIPLHSKSTEQKQAKTQRVRRKKNKKSKRKTKKREHETHEMDGMNGMEEEMEGDTPRIDALLNRFYHRHGSGRPKPISKPMTKPTPNPEPKSNVNPMEHPQRIYPVVNVPSIPLATPIPNDNLSHFTPMISQLMQSQPTMSQTAPENTKRIDLLVERLERLFPTIDDAVKNKEQKEDTNPITNDTEEKKQEDSPIISDEEILQCIDSSQVNEEEKTERHTQTIDADSFQVERPPNYRVELTQDITNDFHINFGWNMAQQREQQIDVNRLESRQREISEMEQKYESQTSQWKQRESELESRVKALELELEGNLSKNKEAMGTLQEQVETNNTLKMETQSLTKQLTVTTNQLKDTMQRLEALQQQYQEKNDVLQQTDHHRKQSQFELSEIRKSAAMTSKLQNERISELVSRSNQNEQELLFTKQTNHSLNTQITNLKATISNFEDDKKLWKETLNNLREQYHSATARLNENQQHFERRLKEKECELNKVRSDCDTVHRKLVMAIKESEAHKKRAQQMNESRQSDVNDLKLLLKESLKSERKLKKTILELNDVVTEQNQSILKYKAELKHLSKDMLKMKKLNQEMTTKIDTDTVIRSNLQEKVAAIQQNYGDLQTANKELRERMDVMKGQMKGLQDENGLLRSKGKELQQRLEADIVELSSLNDKVRVKTVMLNDQNDTISALKEDKRALKETIDSHIEREKDGEDRINDLLAEMDDLKGNNVMLQKEVDRYSHHKEELAAHKGEAEKYRDLYEEVRAKLEKEEEIVHHVSSEVEKMKKMWDHEKRGIKEEFERKSEEQTKRIQSMEAELSGVQQRFKVTDNKLNAERICRQKWEKQCAEVKAKKEETEQEMRLILTEMERIKKTAAHFAKAFNV